MPRPKRARRTKVGLKKSVKIVWRSNIRPHKKQKGIYEAIKPLHWVVVCAGRRGGKTAIAKDIFCKKTTESSGGYFWWCAPTFERSQKAYEEMKQVLQPALHKKSDSRYQLVLKNNAILEFKSLKEWDNLRGEGLSGVIIDEAARVSQGAWQQLLLPALLDNKAWALLISTPNGKNWFYKEYKNKNNSTFHWTTYDNEYLSREAIEKLKELRNELPEDVYRQEILAEFIEGAGGVFRGLPNCLDQNPVTRQLPDSIYCGGIDLGRVNDFTVVTVFRLSRRTNYRKPELVHLDRFTDLDWVIQRERILETMHEYPGEYQIDATWNDSIYEELSNLAPSSCIVTPYVLSMPSKTKLIRQAQVEISNGRILVADQWPENVKFWWEEHRAYEYKVSNAGNVKFSAPEGEHDDVVISSCLALDVALRYSNRDSTLQDINTDELSDPSKISEELKTSLSGTYFPEPSKSTDFFQIPTSPFFM